MRTLLSFLFVLLSTSALLASEWTEVSRTLTKEPAYQAETQYYCLVVLGPDKMHRIWVVRDGADAYIDRNCNGDLTDKGERHAGAFRTLKNAKVGEKYFELNLIESKDNDISRVDVWAYVPMANNELIVSADVRGHHQSTGPAVKMTRTAEAAPVVHLNSPWYPFVKTDVTPYQSADLQDFGLKPGEIRKFTVITYRHREYTDSQGRDFIQVTFKGKLSRFQQLLKDAELNVKFEFIRDESKQPDAKNKDRTIVIEQKVPHSNKKAPVFYGQIKVPHDVKVGSTCRLTISCDQMKEILPHMWEIPIKEIAGKSAPK